MPIGQNYNNSDQGDNVQQGDLNQNGAPSDAWEEIRRQISGLDDLPLLQLGLKQKRIGLLSDENMALIFSYVRDVEELGRFICGANEFLQRAGLVAERSLDAELLELLKCNADKVLALGGSDEKRFEALISELNEHLCGFQAGLDSLHSELRELIDSVWMHKSEVSDVPTGIYAQGAHCAFLGNASTQVPEEGQQDQEEQQESPGMFKRALSVIWG